MLSKKIFGAAVVAACVLVSGAVGAETLKFDLSKQRDADKWVPFTGKWAIEDDAYGPAKLDDDIYPLAALKAGGFTDVEVTIKPEVPDIAFYASGVIRMSTGKNSVSGYHLVAFFSPATVEVVLSRIDDLDLDPSKADWPAYACRKVVRIKKPKPEIIFAAKGDKISATYDGEKVCEFTDKTYRKGQVGLFNLSHWLQAYTAVKIVTP